MDNQKPQRKDRRNSYARFSGLVFQMIAIIGIGTYIGIQLDKKFPNEHNIYTVALSLISVIISVIYIIRRIIMGSKEASDE